MAAAIAAVEAVELVRAAAEAEAEQIAVVAAAAAEQNEVAVAVVAGGTDCEPQAGRESCTQPLSEEDPK